MIDQLKLTDIIDIELLQRLQDAFFIATGISSGISDQNGVAITQHTSCNPFCTEFNKKSPLGLTRCQDCDKYGTKLAVEKGCSVIYTCHAGLTDFAAPIIIQNHLLGCFLGGQLLEKPVDEEKVKKYAVELGLDPEEYLEAAKKVKVYDRQQIEHYASFLHTIGDILSHMAYNKYHVMRESSEIEREAHMKSDFLANMSHEIRTPMNAVIGMAEMALREELPPAAREYITQIKTSGNTLLTIINDILDFSKIESGKMDINMSEYELADVINDVTSIIITRIGTKNVDLIVDFAPDIPNQLMGDSVRIKQVIINLANNAVKFTKKGMVKLTVDYDPISDREILLKVSVEDTGIGIKEEDIGKLFQSFQQLDSKRNRNIEGSGLGLAISKQLISLMNGQIHMESTYGKGSTFFFELPQLILNDSTSVTITDETPITVLIISDNPYINDSLKKTLGVLGLPAACWKVLMGWNSIRVPFQNMCLSIIQYLMMLLGISFHSIRRLRLY